MTRRRLGSTMPAAVNRGDGELVVEDIPVPEIGPADVLVEVSHCGVCGTDLHMILDGWGRPGTTGGHEYSGTVVDSGEEVQGWAPGDRVVIGPGPGCGECGPCLRGRPSLCLSRGTPGTGAWQGAFAPYTRTDQSTLYRVPEGLDLRSAALTEPLAVAVHAVASGSVDPGDRVLVTGAGPIGLLVIAVLADGGVQDITVSEPGEARRGRAIEVGARRGVTPSDMERPRLPMDLVSEPYDVAFECSGRGAAQVQALAQLGRSGRLVFVGAGMDRPRLEANRVLLNELVVTGSNEYWSGDFDRALAMLVSGRLPLDKLIEANDVTLDQMAGALRGLAAGDVASKVLVVPRVGAG
jgi:2-desacetyl-2-hydroxyethyl bacteriochlorophyllide A dehydrogenase